MHLLSGNIGGCYKRLSAWEFVNYDSISSRKIDHVHLEVLYGLEPFVNSNPEYNQTVLQYKYPQMDSTINFSSKTGVIENQNNVWLHPPRDRFFRILEINPFPFIQTPYEIGNKWEWSLSIGKNWGDERWKTWEESIENKYVYEITGKKRLTTKVGNIDCFEIKSTATSSIGKTHLVSYFNEEMGFVKLEYTNIDFTKTFLELIDFEANKHGE